MTVQAAIEILEHGTHYKLIGAMTGKQLADSSKNKEGYIKSFYDDIVSGIFPSFDAQKNNITKVPEYIRPIICIWVSGR